ncbi:uncharacterized protein [Temnothorax nylanderi]|uniref:uncharacterized protein isoform X1 n=1 Tax=Temnothorax nylanderi TaxID=102681 RepID=UPI003A8933AE
MKTKICTKRKFSSGKTKPMNRHFQCSLPLLKTQVSKKRPVLPKIRYSDLNAKYEPPENEVNKHVKRKSKKTDDVIKARKEKESKIIKAHIDAEKQKVKKKQENVSYGNSSKSDSDQLLLKSTYNYKLLDIISAIDDAETVKKVKCLFSDYQICLAERDELKKN